MSAERLDMRPASHMIAEELQAAGVVRRDQHLQTQPAEQRRENLHDKKIMPSARDPP